jgi:hypothetical protein
MLLKIKYDRMEAAIVKQIYSSNSSKNIQQDRIQTEKNKYDPE